MDKELEERIENIAKPLLEKGREGDWEHTLRAIEYARYLLQHEEGDEEIVIPTLYLHDIGWSRVNFDDFKEASPDSKRETHSLSLHMKYGAVLAGEILRDIVFAMENSSATLIVEADRMDRYGPESINRFESMFGENYLKGDQWKQAVTYLREGLDLWFRTKTGKALAEKLARDTGLYN
ncbi:MAG: HD domain-containing protein [Deltaproteobacteria bacterium]|nr:HD domain-containing protein [Deltaproteobacteria bacterium]